MSTFSWVFPAQYSCSLCDNLFDPCCCPFPCDCEIRYDPYSYSCPPLATLNDFFSVAPHLAESATAISFRPSRAICCGDLDVGWSPSDFLVDHDHALPDHRSDPDLCRGPFGALCCATGSRSRLSTRAVALAYCPPKQLVCALIDCGPSVTTLPRKPYCADEKPAPLS